MVVRIDHEHSFISNFEALSACEYVSQISISQGQLKSLTLLSVAISSRDMLAMVEQYEESIKIIQLDCIVLTSASWFHVLSQISKNLKLFFFYLMGEECDMQYGTAIIRRMGIPRKF